MCFFLRMILLDLLANQAHCLYQRGRVNPSDMTANFWKATTKKLYKTLDTYADPEYWGMGWAKTWRTELPANTIPCETRYLQDSPKCAAASAFIVVIGIHNLVELMLMPETNWSGAKTIKTVIYVKLQELHAMDAWLNF